jgi:hypothetical protein
LLLNQDAILRQMSIIDDEWKDELVYFGEEVVARR